MSSIKKTSFLVLGAAVVVVAFFWGLYAYQSKTGAERAETAKANAASLVQFHSPSIGPPDAKVTIVEFLDPSCEACRAFHPIVKSILADYPDSVRLVVRYAPFHQDSDVVVKILEASRIQGLYWKTLDAVFSSQPVWAEHGNPQVQRIWEFLAATGLNVEKAKVDMENPAIAAILKQDIADLTALKVAKTPAFYVNGRPLEVISDEGLHALVKKELISK